MRLPTALLLLTMTGTMTGPAHAGTVRGVVTLPPEPRIPETRDVSLWRVENGVIPVADALSERRGEAVIVLDSDKAPARPPDEPTSQITVELRGLRLDPKVAVARIGQAVQFKNSDRVPHTLFIEHAKSLMPPVPTPAGQTRAQRFLAVGEYPVRDEEYPHLVGTIVVVDSPYHTRLDDKSAFRIEVPEGHYTLRVFYKGGWAANQPLEVTGKTTDVAIRLSAEAPAKPEGKR